MDEQTPKSQNAETPKPPAVVVDTSPGNVTVTVPLCEFGQEYRVPTGETVHRRATVSERLADLILSAHKRRVLNGPDAAEWHQMVELAREIDAVASRWREPPTEADTYRGPHNP